MGFPKLKPLYWVGGSRKDLKKLPEEVQDVFGYALYLAQTGERHRESKTMKGFGSGAVVEVVEDFDGSTYRAVYTVKFVGAVYVLHAFQKKSKRGIGTPQADIDLIRSRFKLAEEDHNERKGNES